MFLTMIATMSIEESLEPKLMIELFNTNITMWFGNARRLFIICFKLNNSSWYCTINERKTLYNC